MKLLERESTLAHEAVIERVKKVEFAKIYKDRKRFPHFDWRRYKDLEVYKIRLLSDDVILGLMCIIDHADPQINAIEIELLEVAIEHVGSKKQIDHIAGCLIAYACRESIKRSHEGVVFLIPKTNLITHYQSKYGFRHEPYRAIQRPHGFMVMELRSSIALVRQYLE